MSSYLKDELKHLWIEDAKKVYEAAWNAFLLMYGDYATKAEAGKLTKKEKAMTSQIGGVLGIFQDNDFEDDNEA